MTTDTTLHVTDPIVYIDLTSTSTTDTYGTGFSAMTDGTYASGRVMWVLAGASLTEGQVVYLTPSASTGAITAALLDTTISGSVLTDVGIVHKAIASGSYGWVWVGPFTNVEVLTTASITAGTQLTTHTVAGTASTGGDSINGLTPIETSVAGLTQCNAIGKLGTNI